MIPTGWKRVGEPTVYWEVRDECGGAEGGPCEWTFFSEAEAREMRRHRREFNRDMGWTGRVALSRITRHGVVRTEVRERLIPYDNHGPDLDVGTWIWGCRCQESIGMYLELSGNWSLWMNGECLDMHPTRAAAEQAVRKMLRDAGYRVVRAKEGT